MRKLMLSALIGLGALGFAAATPSEAKASWLSEALNNTQLQLNIGSQYPVYAPPAYAPAPVYPIQPPAPPCPPPSYSYYPAPVYSPPVRVVPVPVYRPIPVPVPQHSYYGPNRFDHNRYDNHNNWRR
jgi:hypothetical protein